MNDKKKFKSSTPTPGAAPTAAPKSYELPEGIDFSQIKPFNPDRGPIKDTDIQKPTIGEKLTGKAPAKEIANLVVTQERERIAEAEAKARRGPTFKVRQKELSLKERLIAPEVLS